MNSLPMEKRFMKFAAIGVILVQLVAALMPAHLSIAHAAGTTDPTPPNAAGTNSNGTDPTKASWLDVIGCMFTGKIQGKNIDCRGILTDNVKQAVPDFSGWLNKPLDQLFDWVLTIIGNIVRSVSLLMVSIIVFFADPNVFTFATNPFVHAGWYVCLQIANMLIVLGLIILANKYILGINRFGDYKALTDYIIAALFLNFSLTLASMAIGISNFLTLTFLNLTGAPTSVNPIQDIPRNFGDRLAEIFNDIGRLNDVAGSLSGLASVFAATILMLVIFIILAAVAFSFVKRVVLLWIYLILLPLAYVFGKIGEVSQIAGGVGQGNAWKDWMKNFTKELVFGPVMTFFLWLTLFIIANVQATYNPNYTPSSELTNLFSYLLAPFIFIFFLGYGFVQANKAADGGFGFFQTGIDRVSKDLPAWVGRKTVTEPATRIGSQWLQSKQVQDIKAWGARNSNMPILGGLWGRMSQGVSTLEERNKKPIQAMVTQYAKTHNLAAVDDASILVNNIKKAMDPLANDQVAVAANMERLKSVDKGFATLSAEKGVDIGKLEKMMNRAGSELKTDDIYKLNPMRIDRTTSEGKKQFDDILEKATGDEWKKMAQASGNVEFAKAALPKIDNADKFMGMVKGFKGLADNATTLPSYQKMTKDLASSLATGKLDGAVGTMTTGHVKELLENPNIDKGFKNILLQKLQQTMDFKDKESLAKKPGLAKLINDRFRTSASRAATKGITKGTSDGVDYFINFTG